MIRPNRRRTKGTATGWQTTRGVGRFRTRLGNRLEKPAKKTRTVNAEFIVQAIGNRLVLKTHGRTRATMPCELPTDALTNYLELFNICTTYLENKSSPVKWARQVFT